MVLISWNHKKEFEVSCLIHRPGSKVKDECNRSEMNELGIKAWSTCVITDLLSIVAISPIIEQSTRVIIFIIIPFEYSQTQVSCRGGAGPLLDFPPLAS